MDAETHLALHGDRSTDEQEPYVPYVSLDPLNDPKSFTFRLKVQLNRDGCKLLTGRERCATHECICNKPLLTFSILSFRYF